MRNHTNSYNPQATAQEVLGQRNGSSMGSQPKNKKKNIQGSRLLKADGLFEFQDNARVTSFFVVATILKKELVMFYRNKLWKEPGHSTIENLLYRWVKEGKLPNLRATKNLGEGNTLIYIGSAMADPLRVRTMLLNTDKWDLRENVKDFQRHRVIRKGKGRTRVGNGKTKKIDKNIMPFFKRLKFLFFPWEIK